MRRAFLLVLTLVVSGCSFGGSDASIAEAELPKLVLQPSDLSRTFLQFDQGPQGIADSPGGSRADPGRFGREDGWKARYRKVSSQQRAAGPLVIESRADLFESPDGAADDLAAAREDLRKNELDWQPIDEPGLGAESFAATLVQGGVRYFQVFWRSDNATASLNVNGFEPKLPLSDVLALARKQQSHIADAAE